MALPDSLQLCLSAGCLYTPLFKTKSTLFFFFLDHQTGHAARFNARVLLYEFVFDDVLISYVASIYWKSTSCRSALDLATLGKLHNRSALSWLNSFLGTSCMLFDLSIASRLRHVSLAVATPTHRSGACEIWVPLDPHQSGSRPSPTSGSGPPEDPLTCQ